jgi:hypothetical protein
MGKGRYRLTKRGLVSTGRDTRMVERVYGRLSPEENDAVLTAHFAPEWIAGAFSQRGFGRRTWTKWTLPPHQLHEHNTRAESNHRHGDFQSPSWHGPAREQTAEDDEDELDCIAGALQGLAERVSGDAAVNLRHAG